MPPETPAAMSVVIVTPDRYETIRKTIRSLRAQDRRTPLEVVIVAPSANELFLDHAELNEFAAVRVIEIGPMKSHAQAYAEGIRHSTTPIVVLAEDHCYPQAGWAEALVLAHKQPWAAVGPAVRNANPKRSISCADFLMSYAAWSPQGSRVVNHLPGHNSSYKRDILLSYGSDLDEMLEAESVLHWDLRAKGSLLYLEAAARVSHVNFERLRPWISALFHSGRVFAAARSRSWPGRRRFAYTLSSPLIPVVRFWRIAKAAYAERHRLPLRALPVLFFGLSVSAIGEMLGYAAGKGTAVQKLCAFEFHRDRYLARAT